MMKNIKQVKKNTKKIIKEDLIYSKSYDGVMTRREYNNYEGGYKSKDMENRQKPYSYLKKGTPIYATKKGDFNKIEWCTKDESVCTSIRKKWIKNKR